MKGKQNCEIFLFKVLFILYPHFRLQKGIDVMIENRELPADVFNEMEKILLQNLATALAEQDLFDGNLMLGL
jgi:hypothetical protein